MKSLKLTEALLAFAVLTLFSVGAQATLVNTLTSNPFDTDILCRQKPLPQSPYVQNCWRAAQGTANPGNNVPDDEEIWQYFANTLSVPGFDTAGLLYSADYQNTNTINEGGILKDSYTTKFGDRINGKVEGADITFDGGPSVDCMALLTDPCFLLIMGKENSSSTVPFDAYLFNLALGWDPDIGDGWSVNAIPSPNWTGVLPSWDGTEILSMLNFGVNQLGSLSQVALYGSSSGGVSPVPAPAAFWLFGTALLGFIGLSRGTRAQSAQR
jgi:hypothetical protein